MNLLQPPHFTPNKELDGGVSFSSKYFSKIILIKKGERAEPFKHTEVNLVTKHQEEMLWEERKSKRQRGRGERETESK